MTAFLAESVHDFLGLGLRQVCEICSYDLDLLGLIVELFLVFEGDVFESGQAILQLDYFSGEKLVLYLAYCHFILLFW